MATYCRICGVEISFTRTRNEHWMPCDAITGEPHFCVKDRKKTRPSGLNCCSRCGRPVFVAQGKLFDYGSLAVHVCKKADITRYGKYVQKQRLLNLNNKGGISSGSNRAHTAQMRQCNKKRVSSRKGSLVAKHK